MDYVAIDSSFYFEHHGIKGQKWGVRRYQNSDGSLTAAGKSRYDRAWQKRESAEKALRDQQQRTIGNPTARNVSLTKKAARKSYNAYVDQQGLAAKYSKRSNASFGEQFIGGFDEANYKALHRPLTTALIDPNTAYNYKTNRTLQEHLALYEVRDAVNKSNKSYTAKQRLGIQRLNMMLK